MEVKDISLEKQKKALQRIAERQEFMKQQALATKSNYTALQKLKSKIISEIVLIYNKNSHRPILQKILHYDIKYMGERNE